MNGIALCKFFTIVFIAILFIYVNAPKTHKIPFLNFFANTIKKYDLKSINAKNVVAVT